MLGTDPLSSARRQFRTAIKCQTICHCWAPTVFIGVWLYMKSHACTSQKFLPTSESCRRTRCCLEFWKAVWPRQPAGCCGQRCKRRSDSGGMNCEEIRKRHPSAVFLRVSCYGLHVLSAVNRVSLTIAFPVIGHVHWNPATASIEIFYRILHLL